MRPHVLLSAALLVACQPEPEVAASCGAAFTDEVVLDHVTGTREAEWTYTLDFDGSERTIPVHAWYPTAATSGEEARWIGLFDDPDSLVDAPYARDEACKAILPTAGLDEPVRRHRVQQSRLVQRNRTEVSPP